MPVHKKELKQICAHVQLVVEYLTVVPSTVTETFVCEDRASICNVLGGSSACLMFRGAGLASIAMSTTASKINSHVELFSMFFDFCLLLKRLCPLLCYLE